MIVTSSGSMNLLSFNIVSPINSVGWATENLVPSTGTLVVGRPGLDLFRVYYEYDFNGTGIFPENFTGSPVMGIGGAADADYGSGDVFGLLVAGNALGFVATYTSQGYISGTPLAGTMGFQGETLASMGLTPGTYQYAWGPANARESVTVQVVPEPSAAVLGLGALGLMLRRRRK